MELASVSTRRHLERLETGNLERSRGTSSGVSVQMETIAELRAENRALQEELRASKESRNGDRARYQALKEEMRVLTRASKDR